MFEFSRAVNNLADSLVSIPGIGRIVKNPIYTALLITVVIMFIILFIFRNAETADPLLMMTLRGGFYIFVFLTGIIFLHNHVLMNDTRRYAGANDAEGIFTETIISPLETDKIPVAAHNLGMFP